MADTKVRDCVQCGRSFNTPHLGRKCCGPECQAQRSRQQQRKRKGRLPLADRKAERKRLAIRPCAWCGEGFIRKGTYNKHCSKHCTDSARVGRDIRVDAFIKAEAATYARWSSAAKARLRASASINRCNDCSAEVGKNKHRCEPCADKRRRVARLRSRGTPNYRAAKARSKARRRARRRLARVETFDPFEVFDRDGWRCHLCGVKTPKKLRGTYADNAPELDHIVPLSQGGEHSKRNTACSCRKCNIEKADKPLGQMLLIA